MLAWQIFDVDRSDAYFAADDANLPPPNIVIVNRANGHGHLAYLLAKPVQNFASSRVSPLHFLAAVERGMVRRLGADPAYCGMLAKNPLHGDWRAEWQAHQPYLLEYLADWLFAADTRPPARQIEPVGLGRNCTTFDELRAIAYREVRAFKSANSSLSLFQERLELLAIGINTQFAQPMHLREVRGIARSVARWTWRRFSLQRFSAIQRERAQTRTRRHLAIVADIQRGGA